MTRQEKQQVVKLHNNGMTYRELAEKFNVCRTTIKRICQSKEFTRQAKNKTMQRNI